MFDIFNPSSRPHQVLSISCFALRVQRENKQVHLHWSCSLGSPLICWQDYGMSLFTSCLCLGIQSLRVLFLGKSKIRFFNPKTDFPFFKWINSRSLRSWCSKRTEESILKSRSQGFSRYLREKSWKLETRLSTLFLLLSSLWLLSWQIR